MPKLASALQSQVESAPSAGDGFAPLAPGKYVATLKNVDAKTSNAGNPMWVAEFEDLLDLDGNKQPGRQWYNLNLPTSETPPEGYTKGEEKWQQYQRLCAGRIKDFFQAFGYTPDSDTEEMIGERVMIRLSVRTIQSGARAGQETNSIEAVLPLDDEVVPVGATSGGSSSDEF